MSLEVQLPWPEQTVESEAFLPKQIGIEQLEPTWNASQTQVSTAVQVPNPLHWVWSFVLLKQIGEQSLAPYPVWQTHWLLIHFPFELQTDEFAALTPLQVPSLIAKTPSKTRNRLRPPVVSPNVKVFGEEPDLPSAALN